LQRERFLGLAHLLAGGECAGSLALPRGGAGADLEQSHFLGGQRGLLVGVLLVAREQAPGQDRELARDGDDGDLVSRTGFRGDWVLWIPRGVMGR
jgi:hypothetical protein